jgi:phosphate starvation-inducible membrane PsiE
MNHAADPFVRLVEWSDRALELQLSSLMVAQGRASLSDILLLFIYLEIGAMIGIYFKTTRLPVRYLI